MSIPAEREMCYLGLSGVWAYAGVFCKERAPVANSRGWTHPLMVELETFACCLPLFEVAGESWTRSMFELANLYKLTV